MTHHDARSEPPNETGDGAVTRHGRRLLRSWRLTAPLMAVGLVAGVGLATLVPPTYTAETRLLVGGQTLASQSVPGVVFATQELAATYSRFVDDASATGGLQDLIGAETAQTVGSVSASPIPDSSVIILEVSGSDPEDAAVAAQALAEALVAQVQGASQEDITSGALAEYEEVSGQVASQRVLVQRLQTELDQLVQPDQEIATPQASIDAARAEVVTAESQLSVLTLRQDELGARYLQLSDTDRVDLTIARPAEVIADDATLLLLIGAVLGLLVGTLTAMLLAWRTTRRAPAQTTATTASRRSGRERRRSHAGPRSPASQPAVAETDAVERPSTDTRLEPWAADDDDPFAAMRDRHNSASVAGDADAHPHETAGQGTDEVTSRR
ncbi:hypothetical protein [Aquipuribacter sp. MA13-6]|uniref:hypothetical protein n=1 Tax=unclassified Aquipuribacter TaxID=2635084 RepID=UPI003EEB8F04